MESATQLIEVFESSDGLIDLLEKDLKSLNEIGLVVGENGRFLELKEGGGSNVELNVVSRKDEKTIAIHTHPSTTISEPSKEDIKRSLSKTQDLIGLIILSQEMFETTWVGTAILIKDGTERDRKSFKIMCDGTTDGPAEERYIENPQFEF